MKSVYRVLNTITILLVITFITGTLSAYYPHILRFIGAFAIGFWMADLIPWLNRMSDAQCDAKASKSLDDEESKEE